MDSLYAIQDMLKSRIAALADDYFIPEAWNTWGYEKYRRSADRPGEIIVNPYEFLSECIENQILGSVDSGYHETQPGKGMVFGAPAHIRVAQSETLTEELEQMRHDKALNRHGTGKAGGGCPRGTHDEAPTLCRHAIYSMLPRMITAWDHYEKDEICPGTFIKAICLLPWLKRIGIDIISLLPVFEISDHCKKGEAGSPYAIKNIYRLDISLHEPLLGRASDSLLEIEFKAFVEACHTIGMKVMMDFAFRTAARDSDLVISHPDWFYWIHKQYADSISTPSPRRLKKPTTVNDRAFLALYTSAELKEYLSKFTRNPKEADPAKWDRLTKWQAKTGENILDLIESEYNMTTIPAFSDVVNDEQPKWTDVTYLRFYYDVHQKASKYISEDQPPYIMQDGVKLNLYPGTKTNDELFSYISGVIPYYQDKYGIDGARLDMGHALPDNLNREIISQAKERNGEFLFWSEEFKAERAEISKEYGFHFISGTLWALYKDLEKPGFNRKLLQDRLLKSELPMLAALETPDSPRASWVHGDSSKLAQLVLLNAFLPNTIPFLNNGLEVMEKQPMNLGLENSEKGRFVLDIKDPMYGKLAFFDPYRLHWTARKAQWMRELLETAGRLRTRYIDLLSRKDCYREMDEVYQSRKLIFLFYCDRKTGSGVFFLANRDFSEKAWFRPLRLLPDEIREGAVSIVYQDGCLVGSIGEGAHENEKKPAASKQSDDMGFFIRSRWLKPGEVIIGEVSYEKE